MDDWVATGRSGWTVWPAITTGPDLGAKAPWATKRSPIDSDNAPRLWTAAEGTAARVTDGAMNGAIADGKNSEDRAGVESCAPPRSATAHSRRPSPNQNRYRSSMRRTGREDIPRNNRRQRRSRSQACRSMSRCRSRIEAGIGGVVRRPDVALVGHVVPVAVGVQIAPRGV